MVDIASLSIAMANSQVRSDASFAIMNQVKNVMADQGEQLTKMLEESSVSTPHPTHGHHVDITL